MICIEVGRRKTTIVTYSTTRALELSAMFTRRFGAGKVGQPRVYNSDRRSEEQRVRAVRLLNLILHPNGNPRT